MIIPGTEILMIQIDRKIILSHHIKIKRKSKIHNKTRSSTPKHQRQINQVQSTEEIKFNQTLPVLTTQKIHINCESADDESETENTLSIKMLQVENEYGIPIETNCYQNNENFNKFEKLDNIENITDYIEQELKGSSKTNNICRNTANKLQPPEKKIWTIPFLLESPKSKDFQSPDLETEFLIDSGLESNFIIIPTWNGIQTLHPKLLSSKTSSK